VFERGVFLSSPERVPPVTLSFHAKSAAQKQTRHTRP
jgi:hypothetical protein